MSGHLFQLQLGPDAPMAGVRVSQLVIAGWTGRDAAAVERHIRELEALGVPRPSTSPIFYRASVARIAVANYIEAVGAKSSGEVEVALLQSGGRLWLGVGSDHTDREVEAYGVTVSKQMCDKPIAAQFWSFDDVKDHWDALMLRSFIKEGNDLVVYQEGSVNQFREPLDLITRYTGSARLADGTLMFCGTLAAKGGIRPAEQFVFELEDPVLKRTIRHEYRTLTLPIVG